MKKQFFLFIVFILIFTCSYAFSMETANIKIEGVGIEDTNVEVIKNLILAELEKNEIVITGGETAIVYNVKVLALGSKIIITVEKKANNQLIKSEKGSASSIEEVDKVIPRIVDAILNKKDFEDTAKYKNVTEEESKKPLKKKSEVYFGVGLLLNFMAGTEVDERMQYGMSFKLFYEIEYFRLDLELSGSGRKTSNDYYYYSDHEYDSFVIFSIMANFMFSDGDVSPFLGIGLGYGGCNLSDKIEYEGSEYEARVYENTGAYIPVAFGVEFMRLYDIKLIAQLQANFPVQYNQYIDSNSEYYSKYKYAIPVYFSLTVAFSLDGGGCCGSCF